MPRIRIHEIFIRIVDFVDARFLGKVKRQHTAINRPLCSLGKVIVPRDIDVVVVQMEFIRHTDSGARIGTVVLRPIHIHHEIIFQINPIPIELNACRRDVVPHIVRCTRAAKLHPICSVIGLCRIGCNKVDITRIDVRLRDRSLTVAVRRKLVVVRAERRTHRCTKPRIPHRLRARIRIRLEHRIRRTRAVLTRDP